MARKSTEDKFAEKFADLSEWAGPTFRAARLPEVTRRAKRRRMRRRAMVTAAIAVLVALPAVALAVSTRNHSQPVVRPTVTPNSTALPTPGVPSHGVEFLGVWPGQRFQVQMIDRDHGWLYGNCEAALNQPECRYLLGSTSDRGLTWRFLEYPEGVGRQQIEIRTVDAMTLLIYSPQGLWMTKDGGATFTFHTFDAMPIEAAGSGEGPYHMQCTNRQHVDPADDIGECKRKRLVRTGVGPTRYQPPWTGLDTRVVANGPDGRIWLSHSGGLGVSADVGKTWQETGLAGVNEMWLSPSGQYGFARTNEAMWHLAGTVWTRFTLPPGMRYTNNPLPLDDGSMVVGDYTGAGVVKEATFTPFPGVVRGEPTKVLPDGTIILHYQGPDRQVGIYIGVGEGTDREWTLLTY